MNIIHNYHNETIKQLFIIFFKQSMKGPVLNLIYLISVPLAYSAGVFFGRANVLLANAPCWNSKLRGESGASIFSPLPLSFFHPSTYPKGYYFYSLFIFLHHNIKDCGTTVRTQTSSFRPPKIGLLCRLMFLPLSIPWKVMLFPKYGKILLVKSGIEKIFAV